MVLPMMNTFPFIGDHHATAAPSGVGSSAWRDFETWIESKSMPVLEFTALERVPASPACAAGRAGQLSRNRASATWLSIPGILILAGHG
jgi:hypothetical protein